MGNYHARFLWEEGPATVLPYQTRRSPRGRWYFSKIKSLDKAPAPVVSHRWVSERSISRSTPVFYSIKVVTIVMFRLAKQKYA